MPLSNDLPTGLWGELSRLRIWTELPTLLAQNQNPIGSLGMLPAFVLMAVFFYMIVYRPQKRERERREQMLRDGLKKNARIVTIGGIHGIITNVNQDAGRVTIRVDEKNNTELKMNISSIADVITDEKEK